MPNVDWQAYLDGSLPDEEMESTKQLLETSDEAKAEVESLQAFIDTLRGESLQVEVPTDQILARFSAAVQEPIAQPTESSASNRHDLPKLFLWLAPLAAAAVIAIGLSRTQEEPAPQVVAQNGGSSVNTQIAFSLGKSAPIDGSTFNEYTSAFAHVKQSVSNPPPINATALGKVVRSDRGSNWGCIDYLIDGKLYCVSIQPIPGFLRACNLKGEPVVVVAGHGAGYVKGPVSIWVSGADQGKTEKIAHYLYERS